MPRRTVRRVPAIDRQPRLDMGHVSMVSPRWLLAATVVVATFARAAAAQEPAARVGKLSVYGSDFALDKQTGNLAAVDPKQELVALFKPEPAGLDKPLEPIVQTKLRGLPVAIVYKQLGERGYFVVGCLLESAIYLFNAADLKQEARIPIIQGCTSLAASASPRDPYVYYCYRGERPGHDGGKSGIVNLESRRDLGEVFHPAWETAVSADGNFVYTRPNIYFKNGVQSFRRILPANPGDKPTLERSHGGVETHGDIVPEPFEKHLAIGNQLFGASDPRAEIGRLPMSIKAYFTGRPLAVGFNTDEPGVADNMSSETTRGKIVVASLNTGAKIGMATIPPFFFARTGRPGLPNQPWDHHVEGRLSRLFADDARRRIVVAYQSVLAVVTLEEMKVPDEPYLEVDPVGEPVAILGRKNVLPLRPRDPRVTIELAEPRDDMQITHAGLEWTPPADAVGDQIVKLRLRHGSSEKIQGIGLQVEHESIRLPWEADGLAVSRDEKLAFLWTKPVSDAQFPEPDNPFAPGADPNKNRPQGALVSIDDGKVLAAGRLPFTPASAAVDARHIYLGGPTSVVALEHETLALRFETQVEGMINLLELIDGQSLIACSGRDRRLKFATADLSLQLDYGPRNTGGREFQAFQSQHMQNVEFGVRAAGKEWCVNNGDVFDHSFSRPILLVNLPTFMPINVLRSPIPFQSPSISPNSLYRLERERTYFVGTDRLPELRATAAVVREIEHPGIDDGTVRIRKRAETFTLWLSDERIRFTTGEPDRKIVLARGDYAPKENRPAYAERGRGAVVARGGNVYCTILGKLFRIPATIASPTGESAHFGVPTAESSPSFDRKQSHLVLEGDGPVKLKHSVAGGVGPYTFSLVDPAPGLSIDTECTVTADPTRLVPLALDRIAGAVDAAGNYQGRGAFESPGHAAAYLALNAPLFEQIVGRPPKGFPVTLVVGVRASDRTPCSAGLMYQVLLEIPHDQVAARMQSIEQLRMQSQAGGRFAPSPERRFQALEQRVMQLESQIESMKKMLEKK
jgi:hypothetical protein